MNKKPASKFCLKVFDGTHDTPKPSLEGYPLVTSKHIMDNFIDLETPYLISDEDYNKIQKRSRVHQWDVLFTMIGSVGEVYIEANSKIDYAIKNIGAFSCGDEMKAKWLFYYLKSPHAKKFLKNQLSGAVQKFVSLGLLREYPVFDYDKSKDLAIKTLSDLDAKIELNNKINTELEAMAKLIYDYWFVQFDFPDENGKPYKTSGGLMVYNETLKREIPEGWEVKDLEDIESNIVTGKTPSTKKDEFYNGEIPFITIGDIRGNMHITQTEQTLSILGGNQNPNKFLPEGSICVTCIASPGLVGFVTKDSQTNQQINSIICKNEEIKLFLYYYLKDYFKFAKASSGSTFSNMNKGDFSAIKTIKPAKEILLSFSNKLEANINEILVDQLENQKLAELRDWLLPMLMNGQVRVK